MSSPTTPDAVPSDSVIHDIGFRHYDGPRLGRGWAFRSLLIETFRGTFGLGRPSRVKAMPWVLTGLMVATALIFVAATIIMAQSKLPLSYTQFTAFMWLLTAMFVAGRAPYAISRDLRDGVMPLYLSRPILRRDYVLAKFLGLTLGVFAFIAAPVTVLFIGALLAKFPAAHEAWAWLGGLLMAAVLAILLTAISLVVAALSKRRGLGVAIIMTALVLASGFSTILVRVLEIKASATGAAYAALVDPFSLVDGLAASWLGVAPLNHGTRPEGLVGGAVFTVVLIVIIAGSLGILMRRFKKVGGV